MPGKELLIWLTTLIVVLIVYRGSYAYFEEHHSEFHFMSGEVLLLVPDNLGNRALAILYTPISYASHIPIRFEPKPGSRPRPKKAPERIMSNPTPNAEPSPSPLNSGR